MTWSATADGGAETVPFTSAQLRERIEAGEDVAVELPGSMLLTAAQSGQSCVVKVAAPGREGIRWRMPAPLAAELLADAGSAQRLPPSSDWVMGDAASPRLRRLHVSAAAAADAAGQEAAGQGAAVQDAAAQDAAAQAATPKDAWLPILPAVDWIGRRLEEGRAVELALDLRERFSAIPLEDGAVRLVLERAGHDDGTGWEAARVVPHPMVVADAAEQILLAWLSLEPRPAVAAQLRAPDAEQAAELEASRRRFAPSR